jgi:hypothetical protein
MRPAFSHRSAQLGTTQIVLHLGLALFPLSVSANIILTKRLR